MTRIIVHAGFHKTGTSSLQTYLGQNRHRLKPYFDYYGQPDFPKAAATSRIYGQRPFAWRRRQFRRAFRAFLKSVANADTVVLSRETFAGVMPGHRDILRRTVVEQSATAIALAQTIIMELHDRFGPLADIRFLYTTRQQQPWLRSVYGHLLRSIHLTEDFDAFCDRFATLPDPEIDAQSVASALAPVPVYIARMEDFIDQREGIAAALLDLAEVPVDLRDELPPATHQNKGQSAETEAAFLQLNRSGKSKQQLKLLKEQILSEAAAP